MLAVAAGGVQPRDAYPVAFLDPLDAGADGGDKSDAFVSRDERQRWLDGPVSVSRMQVGMADAGGDHLDEHLAGRHLGYRNLLDLQGLAEGVNDSGLHRLHELLRFIVIV